MSAQRIRVEFAEERLEECDGCGESIPIRVIQLTGQQFLCPVCGDEPPTQPKGDTMKKN